MSGCVFLNKKILFLSYFAARNMGEKSGLSAVERSKIVTQHKGVYSERKISEKLKLSKTEIHHEISRF